MAVCILILPTLSREQSVLAKILLYCILFLFVWHLALRPGLSEKEELCCWELTCFWLLGEASKMSVAFAPSPPGLTEPRGGRDPISFRRSQQQEGHLHFAWTFLQPYLLLLWKYFSSSSKGGMRNSDLRLPLEWLAGGSKNTGRGEARVGVPKARVGKRGRRWPQGLNCSVFQTEAMWMGHINFQYITQGYYRGESRPGQLSSLLNQNF